VFNAKTKVYEQAGDTPIRDFMGAGGGHYFHSYHRDFSELLGHDSIGQLITRIQEKSLEGPIILAEMLGISQDTIDEYLTRHKTFNIMEKFLEWYLEPFDIGSNTKQWNFPDTLKPLAV
jgi:hypothetical protein